MNAFTKVATLIVATGLVTTLVLPGRQTDKVLSALFGGVSKWQATAMGTRNG
ncbi:hypothetical protein JGS39_24115 [Streptomyces sp. P01-B04]|uniref:hypothetical protein n=1 Tax=Streptomyces poriferorum TaxID=2798799 RepID=UPI001C5F879D|nr:hypothetical protein [Streptomyces poriferorum]MBW5252048.1 hypothetical protein [Streptomyces poriferorum]MBW5260218.1 hypothetical protein [Streptomyces poriferorum]